MLLTRRELFQPLDLKRRVFTKIVRPGDRQRSWTLLDANGTRNGSGDGAGKLSARALDVSPVPQLVVAADRTLVLANEAARRMLRVGTPDLGRPLQELEVSYRPAELRGSLDLVFAEQRAVTEAPVTHRHDGHELWLQAHLAPLRSDGHVEAVLVTFADVSELRRAEDEVERSQQELGAAYEELQSTVEELETTNEELQSTNEELETTNEELQSTNEELETMNEELQSTNEELETMNDELRQRSLDLREANAVMEAVLLSEGVGIVVVDRDERVRVWSTHSEELWGVREEEVVGELLRDLDIGLPVGQVRPALRTALLDGGEPVSVDVDATDRRGRRFPCRITVVPLTVDGGEVTAAIMLAQRRPDA